ncbi:hypothetical protein [Ancylobacter polymorphus]|uniref:Uncharacterized protein n=1 Tax=Ancylobacter polymorphus TaxID=223390 RepID=A0A9E7A7I0_9HYPH|nr:hypothetical protein [Ancylobacter polymorphus]UOK71058.1 hypothetical protein K9D25_20525 [Ancylobacter polymorphus]
MSVPGRSVSPEALEEARRLYERTNVPVQQVADLLGISKSTFNLRRQRWGWTPRMARIPGAPALLADTTPQDPTSQDLLTDDPPVAGPPPVPGTLGAAAPAEAAPASRSELINRLVRRIEREIAALERLVALAGLAVAARPEASQADSERAARTLAILVRALRELAALDREQPDGSDDDADRDADAFRRELGRTLERVLAGGQAA